MCPLNSHPVCVCCVSREQAGCLLPSQQQVRKASAVVDVQDPKEFKKLLKTTPNVLCLFVKGAGVAKEMKRVVGLTAEQVKGVGSVFYVDCSGCVQSSVVHRTARFADGS